MRFHLGPGGGCPLPIVELDRNRVGRLVMLVLHDRAAFPAAVPNQDHPMPGEGPFPVLRESVCLGPLSHAPSVGTR